MPNNNLGTYKLCLLVAMLISFNSLSAQKTIVFEEKTHWSDLGDYFFNERLFGAAIETYNWYLEEAPTFLDEKNTNTVRKAKLNRAKSIIRLDRPDGELNMLEFVRNYQPERVASEAMVDMGNYYFKQGKYKEALAYYELVDNPNLSNDELIELKFKTGYSLFVRKRFTDAERRFDQIKEIDSKYYFPANYYYGVCRFFDDDFDAAQKAFVRVNASSKYSRVVPYYIAQIHFAKKEYTELIEFSKPYLNDKSFKYHGEINQLVGQSYFELGDYNKALPYMENYVAKGKDLDKQAVYQVGYTQYQAGKYQEASKNFEILNKQDNPMGQNAMYHLADCYLKLNNKNAARNAFQKAAEADFNKTIQSESKFNYAKLSYELGHDREAINGLQAIPANSTYYNESQQMLADLFLNTKDYQKALETIEGLSNKSQRIKEVYQKVAFNRGLQQFNDKKYTEAKSLFNKSLTENHDAKLTALAHYWIADIDYQAKNYDSSISHFQNYLKSGDSNDLEIHGTFPGMANYGIGYNYLKKKNYKTASGFFERSVSEFEQKAGLSDYIRTQILPDAILRTADCHFNQRNFDQAQSYYLKIINRNAAGYDYAQYQNSFLLGLKGNNVEKIIALEDITKNHPNSEFADDAFFELGNTYLEIDQLNLSTKMYEDLLKKYPSSDLRNQTNLKLGLVAINQGQQSKALNYYKAVISNNPTASEQEDALAALEEIYVSMGDPDGYFAFLDGLPGKGISDPEKDEITFKAGELPYEKGEYEKAIAGYNKYLNKYPYGKNALLALFHRAESLRFLKNYEQAVNDYETLVNRGVSQYYNKACQKGGYISYNALEDFPKAFFFYSHLKETADSEELLYEALQGVLRSGFRSDQSAAVKDASTAMLIHPKATEIDRAEAHYYSAKMFLAEEAYNDSRSQFNEVIKLTDNVWSAEARYQIANIYFLENDLETAQALCLQTNKEIQNYQYWFARSVILLGDIFAEKGDLFNARASLESIINNYVGEDEIVELANQKLEKVIALENKLSRLKPDQPDNGDLEMEEDSDLIPQD